MRRRLECMLVILLCCLGLAFTAHAAQETVDISVSGTFHYTQAYEALELINESRADEELDALVMDQELIACAMQRAVEISVLYDDTRPDGTDISALTTATVTQIKNANHADAESVVSDWLATRLMQKQILGASYQSVGVGCFTNNGITYWVLLLCAAQADEAQACADVTTSTALTIDPSLFAGALTLSGAGDCLCVGESLLLTATLSNPGYSGASCALDAGCLSWSSDSSSAVVDATGLLCGASAGSATVTAAAGSLSAEISVETVALTAPEIIAAENTGAAIEITYSCVAYATQYRIGIYTSDSTNVYYVYQQDWGDETQSCVFYASDSDFPLTAGTTYTVFVQAVNENGFCGDASATQTVVCLTAPTLKCATNASGGVTLTWSAADGASGYYVYRKISGETSFTLLATISSASTLTYTDATATNGTTYIYQIRAYSGDSTCASGNTEIIYLLNGGITSLTNSSDGVVIKWSKNSAASKYLLYRKASGESEYTLLTTISSASTVTYTDTSANGGTSYTYKLIVCSDSTKSAAATQSIRFLTPTAVSAENASANVKLSWQSVTGASKYYVYRKVYGGSYELVKTTSATSWTDTSVQAAALYYYYVRPVYGSSIGAAGDTAKIITKPALTVTSTASKATLQWSASATNGVTYYVYRKASGESSYTQIKKTTSTTWTDTSIKSGVKYTYKVRAVRSGCSSVESSALTAKYLAKTTITLTNTSSGVKLQWSKVSGASGYYIYRKTASGSYSKIKTVTSASTLSYTDKSIASKNGTTYIYKIVPYYKNSSATVLCSGVAATKTTVRLTGTTLRSVTSSAAKKMTVKWTKASKVTGYQLQYSTGKSFSSKVTVTIKGASKVSRSISGLLANKKYYVRVRTYKTVNGTKYYSAWSSLTSVKTMK